MRLVRLWFTLQGPIVDGEVSENLERVRRFMTNAERPTGLRAFADAHLELCGLIALVMGGSDDFAKLAGWKMAVSLTVVGDNHKDYAMRREWSVAQFVERDDVSAREYLARGLREIEEELAPVFQGRPTRKEAAVLRIRKAMEDLKPNEVYTITEHDLREVLDASNPTHARNAVGYLAASTRCEVLPEEPARPWAVTVGKRL